MTDTPYVELDDDWGLVHPDDPSKVLDQAKLDIVNMKPIVDDTDTIENPEVKRDALRSGEKAIQRIRRVQEHVDETIETPQNDNHDEHETTFRADAYIRAYADLVGASVALQMTGRSELVDTVNEAKEEVRTLIEEHQTSTEE